MLSMTALIFSVQPHLGITEGNLDWNIAQDLSGSAVPNILSELEFENISARQYGIGAELRAPLFWDGFSVFLEGELSAARVLDGDSTDTDFAGNNRTDIYSLSTAEIEGDDINAYQGGGGLRYELGLEQHAISLIVGGQQQEQELNFKKGLQLIADASFFQTVTLGQLNAALRALDSNYLARWHGPWLALQYEFHWNDWSVRLRRQEFRGEYYGEGEWNLREDFRQPRSFVHEADANGTSRRLQVSYAINDWLEVQGTVVTNDWETEDGVVSTYFSNNTFSRTRFNGAAWDSKAFLLGLSFNF